MPAISLIDGFKDDSTHVEDDVAGHFSSFAVDRCDKRFPNALLALGSSELYPTLILTLSLDKN